MNLNKRVVLTALAAAALAAPCAVAAAQPAAAAVSGCSTSVSILANTATATCTTGSGSFRVVGSCQPAWAGLPITLFGPWTNRLEGQASATSTVQGTGGLFGCGMASARVEVLP